MAERQGDPENGPYCRCCNTYGHSSECIHAKTILVPGWYLIDTDNDTISFINGAKTYAHAVRLAISGLLDERNPEYDKDTPVLRKKYTEWTIRRFYKRDLQVWYFDWTGTLYASKPYEGPLDDEIIDSESDNDWLKEDGVEEGWETEEEAIAAETVYEEQAVDGACPECKAKVGERHAKNCGHITFPRQ